MMISISSLPGDLESEILSRVPATILAQLRFTCKRWYALFKDPKFIKKNLGKTAAAMQMVLKKDKSVYSFSMDFSGIHNRYDQFVQFTGKVRSLKDSEDVKISEISHCEGLLLCKTKDKRLVVWNPCTGQTRLIQSRVSSKPYPMWQKYFLGYENKDKDSYKILSLSRYQNDQKATVEMYELNSDSWRVLDGVTKTFWEHGVSLKGNTYWLDSVTEEGTLVNFILRFDFSRERFGRLPLPFDADDEDDLVAVLSVFREEKLAVLYQMVESYTMNIWMTNDIKTDDLSWSEFLVVDFEKLVRNGMTRVMSFLVDKETKRVMCCDTDGEEGDMTRIYIAGEDIYKQVYKEITKESEENYDPLLLSYVPSLVHIPARQSDPGDKRKRHGQEAIALAKSK